MTSAIQPPKLTPAPKPAAIEQRRALRQSGHSDAMSALAKAWTSGWRDVEWTRRDPDLAALHGLPEFERMYPEKSA